MRIRPPGHRPAPPPLRGHPHGRRPVRRWPLAAGRRRRRRARRSRGRGSALLWSTVRRLGWLPVRRWVAGRKRLPAPLIDDVAVEAAQARTGPWWLDLDVVDEPRRGDAGAGRWV